MNDHPDSPHRQSIRLDGYDYSSEGCYFVTICASDRECLFGKIVNEEMQMNGAGRMVERWYLRLEQKFPSIQGLDYVVMPNHFHCILHLGNQPGTLHSDNQPVGADLCVRPNTSTAVSLSTVIQWFKTMTTNEYYRQVKAGIWPAIRRRLWQRNYYEHIIRSQLSFDQISDYIRSNPTRWTEDQLFVE